MLPTWYASRCLTRLKVLRQPQKKFTRKCWCKRWQIQSGEFERRRSHLVLTRRDWRQYRMPQSSCKKLVYYKWGHGPTYWGSQVKHVDNALPHNSYLLRSQCARISRSSRREGAESGPECPWVSLCTTPAKYNSSNAPSGFLSSHSPTVAPPLARNCHHPAVLSFLPVLVRTGDVTNIYVGKISVGYGNRWEDNIKTNLREKNIT
jgi:hypothetical protein